MSKPIDYKTTVLASSTSHVADLPGNVPENSLIVVSYAFGAIPGTFTPPTGYTEITLSDNTDGTAAALYVCQKVAGASETSIPAATFSSAQPCTAGVVIFDDINTSSPIGNVSAGQGVARYSDTPALTTTVANSSILHVIGYDQVGSGRLLSGGKLLAIDGQASEGISLSYGFKRSTGVTTPAKYKCSDNNIIASIEIKDSGSGSCLPHMDTSTPLKLMFGSNAVTQSSTTVLTTLNSLTCDDPADTTMASTFNLSGDGWANSENVYRNEIFSSMSLDRYGVADFTFADTDLTANPHILFAIGPHINSKFTDTVANGGVIFGVYTQRGDAGQAWRAWTVSGRDDERFQEASEIDLNIIDITDTGTMIDSAGTFDITKVDGFFVAVRNDLAHTPDIEWKFREQIYAVTPIQFIGGDTTTPITVADIFNWIEKCYAGHGELQGSAQGIARFPLIIGNGTDDAVMDLSGSSIEFEPSRYSGTFKHYIFDDNFLGLRYKPKASGTISHKNSVVRGSTPFHWGLSSAVTITDNEPFNGLQVIGPGTRDIYDIGFPYKGLTISGGNELNMATGADLSGGCVIDDTAGTQAVTITDQTGLDELANCTFSNNGIAIRVDVSGSISLIADNITFTGNTVDVHYTGTGTLTWENANGSNASTETSPTGTVNFVNPGTGIEFTGLVAGSQVVVCETGTQTELYRDNNSATSEDWDTTGDQGTVDYTIMKAGYLPVRATGVVVGLNKLSVGVEQVFDPVYQASSGLTHTTDTSYNTGTKRLTLTKATTIRNLYSAWIEFWIAQSAYVNKPFTLQAYGFNTVAFIDDAEFVADSHGETYVTRGGWRYVQTDGDISAQWAGILSIGTATGFTGEYQQVAGSTVTNAAASGAWDQAIKIYGDATHGNFDYRGHLVLKYQPDGYRPSEVDVYGTYGTLFDTLYVVAMEPTLIDGLATGDPSPTGLSITNHGASPVTWNSKDFSITITDSGSNTGATILQWLRYNCSLDATFQSQDPFNWPEMVVEDGTKYKTERGTLWGSAGATLKGVRVIDGSGNPHVSFSTMMADDGTVYTVPTTAGIQAANLTAGWAELYNVTQATLIESVATTSGYLYTWVDGTDADAGDVLRLRWRGLGKEEIEASVVATADTTVQVLDTPVTDAIYDAIGIDGSTVTEFTLDSGNVQFDLDDPDNVWYVGRMYAWYSYAMVSAAGIANFWGAVTAVDASNIRINNDVVDVKLDNLSATSCRQGDTIVLYRADGAYPQVSVTTGGGGIGMYYAGRGYTVETGVSGLTAGESTKLNSIVAGTDTVDGSISFLEAQKIVLAAVAGKLSGADTNAPVFYAQDGTTPIITATTDTNGNRTAVSLSP